MRDTSWRLELFFAVFLIFFFIFQLGSYPLFVPDEGRYGEIAREMAANHDWLTPRLNGIPFLDKPILFYWMAASFISWCGATLWAVRIWPVIVACLGCLVIYYTAWQLYGRRAARISTIILASTPLYFLAGHYVNMDLSVAVFLTASLCSFLLATKEAQPKRQLIYFFAAYVFSGLAILTKGLIGIVFPMLIIGTWILLTQQWRWLLKMWLMPGLAIVALVCMPWFLLEQQANPNFFDYFFLNQHFARFTQHSFNNLQSWWFYFFVVSVGFLPWSVLWPCYSFFSKPHFNWQKIRSEHDRLYLLLWVSIILLFFSLPASKLVGYILPVFPPLALLLGRWWDQHWPEAERRFKIIAVASFVFLFGVMAYLPFVPRYSSAPLAAAISAQHLEPNERVSVYHFYLPDLAFYLQRELDIVAVWGPPLDLTTDGWKRPFWYAKYWNMTNDHMILESDFWTRWRTNQRQLIVVRSDVAPLFIQNTHGRYKLIWQKEHLFLFSNQVDAPAKAQSLASKKVINATNTMAKATAKG